MTSTKQSTTPEEREFSASVERYRRELHVHCYRMLGSVDDADDALQDAFLRAWRSRDSFAGRSTLRAWLYRIATNASLDLIERRGRRPQAPAAHELSGPAGAPTPPVAEILWLQPYPDALLDAVPAPEAEPDVAITAKETVELAFLVAIQHLPPQSRAVLILRDVLSWSARDTAELLDTTPASVNSALQRARAGLKEHLPADRLEWSASGEATDQERELVARYIELSERGDSDALKAILSDDLRWTMPPDPLWAGDRDTAVRTWEIGGWGTDAFGHLRCVATRANRQPAVATYNRKPGDDEFRFLVLDVLRIEDGAVAEITTFGGIALEAFGLPETL